MTLETATPETNRLARQRLYRRLMFGSVLGGVTTGVLVRDVLGYPLLGELLYWIGIVGFLAVWLGTSTTLFDERDLALERRAGSLTLLVIAPVLVLGASVGRVLPQISEYALPPEAWQALYAYASVYGVFGIVYLVLRYRG